MKKSILSIIILFVMAFFFIPQNVIAQTAERPALLESSGEIWSWGLNNFGQLGLDDESSNIFTPTEVDSDIVYAAAGQSHTLFIKSDSTLWGMGDNREGQLGIDDESITAQLSPVEIAEDVVYASVFRGTSFFITSDGTLWAMGLNSHGQLGYDSGSESQFSPVQVGLENIVAVAGGANHTLFLANDGTLYGSGANSTGQIGQDWEEVGASTVPVEIDSDVTQITSGYANSVYLKGKELWSVGRNHVGQLGIGDEETGRTYIPQLVADDVVSVACYAHSCLYVDDNDDAWGFGNNGSGQLGNGSTGNEYAPVQVENGNDVNSISVGQSHSMITKNDDSMWITGSNNFGQLGLGEETNQIETPQQITFGEENPVMLSAGANFNFVIDREEQTQIEVLNALGTIELDEDFGNVTAAVLDTVFTNPDESSLEHEIIEFDSNIFSAELVEDTLLLKSVENKFGSGEVVLKATASENNEAFDTLSVEVLSVNDPPQITGIPDTVDLNNEEEITVQLDTSITDVEDELDELEIDFTVESEAIDVVFNEEDFSITLSAENYEGTSSLTITVTDTDGSVTEASVVIAVETQVSNELDDQIPGEFALEQNYPNPFNPTTQIKYDVPEASKVKLQVFDMLGRRVATLINERKTPGSYRINFDAAALSSGVYIYQIQAGDFVQTRSMTLIK